MGAALGQYLFKVPLVVQADKPEHLEQHTLRLVTLVERAVQQNSGQVELVFITDQVRVLDIIVEEVAVMLLEQWAGVVGVEMVSLN